MKLIETINNTALAVAAVPEALHEARWMMHELAERDGMPARLQRLIEGAQKKDKRIAELEIEVRKLTEANHGLAGQLETAKRDNQSAASELNRARADAASMRLEVERLQSEVARLSAPEVSETAVTDEERDDSSDVFVVRDHDDGLVETHGAHPTAFEIQEDATEALLNSGEASRTERMVPWRHYLAVCEKLAVMRAEVARGGYTAAAESALKAMTVASNGEPAIPEPEVGDGWEFCARQDATEYIYWFDSRWGSWYPMGTSDCTDSPYLYRFRRPIAKPEPKWVACAAEEARESVGNSRVEWFSKASGVWNTLSVSACVFDSIAYRSAATLPLEITVPKSVWDRAPAEARHKTYADGGEPVYLLVRSRLPDGFRLDAP